MSEEQRRPSLSDADLLAYLDGEVDETVAQQIEASADHRRRLAELAQAERGLAAALYRATCPTALELGEYHLDLLPPARAALVAQHVDRCPHCALELQDVRAYLQEMAPDLDYTLLERVRVLVARLVPDLPAPGGGPAPALVGIRGEESGPLLYEAGDVQVSLEVQDDAGGADRKSIVGLITGVDPASWQVTLWQDDGEELEAGAKPAQTVDELGNFILEALQPGDYRLVLRGEDVEVVIQDLTVS